VSDSTDDIVSESSVEDEDKGEEEEEEEEEEERISERLNAAVISLEQQCKEIAAVMGLQEQLVQQCGIAV
jgi:hypothetical protein